MRVVLCWKKLTNSNPLNTPIWNHSETDRAFDPRSTTTFLPRGNMARLFVLACLLVASVLAKKEPQVTHKVFFDIQIDGKDAGRIVMGLFGKVRLQDVTFINVYTILSTCVA
jgi:hypothetical protein